MKTISLEEFKSKKKEGDGICRLCLEWSLGTAEPMSESVYCSNCDNRAVVGVQKACDLGIVKVME